MLGITASSYKYLHADFVPESLVSFLDNGNFFVGKGIENDVKKLWDDCGLRVSQSTDVADMARRNIRIKILREFRL